MGLDVKVVAAVCIAVGLFLPFGGWWTILRVACLIIGVWVFVEEWRSS